MWIVVRGEDLSCGYPGSMCSAVFAPELVLKLAVKVGVMTSMFVVLPCVIPRTVGESGCASRKFAHRSAP
jgi:hypothetical protein